MSILFYHSPSTQSKALKLSTVAKTSIFVGFLGYIRVRFWRVYYTKAVPRPLHISVIVISVVFAILFLYYSGILSFFATDDYLVKNIGVEEVEIFDDNGQPVKGKGVYKIVGDVIYVFPRDQNWSIIITATATDSSWDSTTKILSEELLWCK